jgi:endonuclease YncB( thermonuclease family)
VISWPFGSVARTALAAAFVALATSDLAARSSKWVTLENCRLVPNPANDGDSFHVRVKRKEYIFRLYFVDAPETDAALADRVAEQAKYFGITVEQTLKVGELAKSFITEKLSHPFTVRTCRQDALGRSKSERFYAIIRAGNEDLAEELVKNGLARIYGASAKPVGLFTVNAEWAKLEQLQSDAKGEKVGAWGVNFGRMTVRSQKEGGVPYDPFGGFFHPLKTGSTNEAADLNQPKGRKGDRLRPSHKLDINSVSSADSVSLIPETKLEVNTASRAELENIPGIGPEIAQRIIEARPFKSADDLRNVKGIGGGKRFEKIRPYFN